MLKYSEIFFSEYGTSMVYHTRNLSKYSTMPTIKVRKYSDSVYVVYSHRNKIFKIFTGVKIEDRYWNLSVPKKNCPGYDNKITQINSMEVRVLNASMKIRSLGIDPAVDLVKKEFYSQVAPDNQKQDFWETYKEYLELLTCRESTRRKIAMTYRVIEYFCKWSGYKFEIDTFDKTVFGRFVQYLLLHQHMADSTIQRHVKWLRTFLRYAYPDKDISFVKYAMLAIEEEIIVLTEGELRYLIDADLGGYLERTRDLFVFLATTGMRFCDSQLFDPSWVTEEQNFLSLPN